MLHSVEYCASSTPKSEWELKNSAYMKKCVWWEESTGPLNVKARNHTVKLKVNRHSEHFLHGNRPLPHNRPCHSHPSIYVRTAASLRSTGGPCATDAFQAKTIENSKGNHRFTLTTTNIAEQHHNTQNRSEQRLGKLERDVLPCEVLVNCRECIHLKQILFSRLAGCSMQDVSNLSVVPNRRDCAANR